MNNGFIKLHRQMMRWEWYTDVPTRSLFIHLLLNANFKATKHRGYDVPAGGFVAGRKTLSVNSGLSEQQVRTALKKLEQTGEITSQSTNSFTIISITYWKKYQAINQRITNEQPADNQRITNEQPQNKNVKEGKNVKEVYNTALDLYNDMAEKAGLSKAQKLTSSRKAKLKARLKDCGGIDGWKAALEILEKSSFLTGQKTDFKANLDFILQESSFVKLMEGAYNDNRNNNNNGKHDGNTGSNQQEMPSVAAAVRKLMREYEEEDNLY